MKTRRRWGIAIGMALSLIVWVVAPSVSDAATSSTVATPIFADNFSAGTLTPFVANNDLSPGGQWSIVQDTLTAQDYGLTQHLPNQIASVPHVGRNVVLSTAFTIKKLNPHQPYRIGVFGRGSAPKTGASQWDIVLSNGNLELINQFLGVPAKIPFPVQAGQSYNLVAVVDGTWVGAQLWPVGSPQPSQWSISGSFANTGRFTAVGVAAGNASVSFDYFDAYVPPPQLSVQSDQPSAMYQSGQPLSYTATLSANGPSQVGQSYSVDYLLTKLGGAITAQGTVPVTIPASGPAQFTISLPQEPNGYYHVAFSLTAETPGLPITAQPFESNTTGLAVVPSIPMSSRPDPQSSFGINGPGNQYGPITPTLEKRWVQVDQLFKDQGVDWIRTQFLWNDTEPSPNSYTWDTSDGLVVAGHATGENLIGLVDYAGNYANPFVTSSGSRVSFARFVKDYDQYIQALVTRYMPGGTLAQQMGWQHYGISSWEIWNEPSQKQYWPSQNPVQYAELVRSASQAVKAVDPDATVLAYAWQLPTLVKTAGTTSFTGISIHAYPAYPSQSAFYQTIADLRQQLQADNIGSDPIWMTETGWSVARVSATQQAEYVERAAIQSLAASLNKFFLFDWSYPSSGYGELTKSLLPLPEYPALAAVSAALQGYTPVAGMNPISMGSAIQAFVFQNGSESQVALWSPKNQGSLILNSPGISAVDWMDNPILPSSSGLTIPLTSQPVFVTGDMSPQALVNLIQGSSVTGVTPVSLSINPPSQPSALAPIQVTVTNQVNAAQSGTVTLTLPSGWEAVAIGSGAASTPSDAPSVSFGPLAPGASLNETFDLVQFQASPSNQYQVTASATTFPSTASSASTSGPTASATVTLNPTEAVYGTPRLSGSFSDWGTALPFYLDQQSQNMGIADWSPNLASATAYTMWNTKYLYVAAQVVDQAPFFEPYQGRSLWQGDSVQIYLDPSDAKSHRYNGRDGDTLITLARTPAGNQVYERHPVQRLLRHVKLVTVPGPENGDMLYEAAIPVDDLPHWQAQCGHSFGLDLLVNYNFGTGRAGWIELAPGVGNTFDSADFPTFTTVNRAPLAALALDSNISTGTVSFTPDATGATLKVTNNGVQTLTVSLSTGTTLTLTASPNAQAQVNPSGTTAVVPIRLTGTTSINLGQEVSPGTAVSLSAAASPQSGSSAILTVENGMNGRL